MNHHGTNGSTASLEHAFVGVRDMERSLAYYQTLFPDWGIRWTGTHRGSLRWVHFGAPGPGQPSYLSLAELGPAAEPLAVYGQVAINHLGFRVQDLAGTVARLRRAGIEPTELVDDDPAFARAYYSDPDGHELELVEARPPRS